MPVESMMTQSQYVVSWLIVVFFLGMAWYVVDRSIGNKLYRLWYNWTNKEKLPDDSDVGFIYKRKAKVRATWATLISAGQSMLAVWGSNVNPFYELIYFFFEIPVIMAGFYAGPALFWIWSRKDNALEKLDKIESGEIDLGEEIHRRATTFGAGVREILATDDEPQGEPVAVPQETFSSEDDQTEEPDIDPHEALKRFTEGRSHRRPADDHND